jgi:type IV pilus assembly protein PilM
MSDTIGIDIGSYAIKMARISRGMSGGELQQLGVAYNPVGQFLPADQVTFQKLAETLKQFAAEQHFKGRPVTLALPESLAYTSVINMPFLSEAELASSIHWEAEQHIPVPIDEINLEYEILYKPRKDEMGEKMRVLLVGARKDVIERLVNLFHLAGLEIVGLETVLLGVYRALTPVLQGEGAVVVVHIGALTTDILISQNGELVLTYTVQTGGLALTRALEKGLELPATQAEEYKRTYGLDQAQLEGRVRQVLLPVLNILVAEIRKAMQYYQTGHMLSPIRQMIISGGSAYLPGLTTYLAETFTFEVVMANPLDMVKAKSSVKLPQDSAAFTAAIGLANKPESK